MSNRTVIPLSVSPLANTLTVIPARSTAQTYTQISATSTTCSKASQPTLSNKEEPESPLDAATHSTTTAHSVLEHSAPQSRDQSVSFATSVAGLIYSALSITDLTKIATEGDPVAQCELGKRFHRGSDVPKSYKEAMVWYSRSAEQGYSNAQHNLGEMNLRGQGVEKNSSKAVEWFTKAANLVYVYSKYKLSLLYQSGQGVEKNDAIESPRVY